jgi:hypothetical protein
MMRATKEIRRRVIPKRAATGQAHESICLQKVRPLRFARKGLIFELRPGSALGDGIVSPALKADDLEVLEPKVNARESRGDGWSKGF